MAHDSSRADEHISLHPLRLPTRAALETLRCAICPAPGYQHIWAWCMCAHASARMAVRSPMACSSSAVECPANVSNEALSKAQAIVSASPSSRSVRRSCRTPGAGTLRTLIQAACATSCAPGRPPPCATTSRQTAWGMRRPCGNRSCSKGNGCRVLRPMSTEASATTCTPHLLTRRGLPPVRQCHSGGGSPRHPRDHENPSVSSQRVRGLSRK